MKFSIRFSAFLFLLTFLTTPAFSDFQVEKEFPNYFTKENQTVDSSLVEKAIGSVANRIYLPYHDGEKLTQGYFFREVLNQIKSDSAVSSKVRIYISGGVVRSLLGFIYYKIYHHKERHPETPVEAILQELIESDQKISAIQALGIGSDLDLLIDSPDKDFDLQEIKMHLTQFVNSAEKEASLRKNKSRLKYSLVPIADVKEYLPQIQRARSQGGSTLDLLAYDLESQTIRHPEGMESIFESFLQGYYDYKAPTSNSNVRLATSDEFQKQAIRGLRPLLEVPFLRLTHEGKTILATELEQILRISKERLLDRKAMEQWDKLIRNARFAAAKNRFYREESGPGMLAVQISNALNTFLFKAVVPEFADLVLPELREYQEFEETALMSLQDFQENYMHQSEKVQVSNISSESSDSDSSVDSANSENKVEYVLFHGTPESENLLFMIRNGFVLSQRSSPSSSHQGTAAYGRGVYMTPKLTTAKSYAKGDHAAILTLRLKSGVKPRILDWKTVQVTSEMRRIQKVAKEKGRDPFEYLAHVYGIDIIVNTHVLVQNAGIFELPSSLKDIVELQRARVLAEGTYVAKTSYMKPTYDFYTYASFYGFASALGYQDMVHPLDMLQVPEGKQLSDHELNRLATALGSEDPRVISLFSEAIARLKPSYYTKEQVEAFWRAYHGNMSLEDFNTLTSKNNNWIPVRFALKQGLSRLEEHFDSNDASFESFNSLIQGVKEKNYAETFYPLLTKLFIRALFSEEQAKIEENSRIIALVFDYLLERNEFKPEDESYFLGTFFLEILDQIGQSSRSLNQNAREIILSDESGQIRLLALVADQEISKEKAKALLEELDSDYLEVDLYDAIYRTRNSFPEGTALALLEVDTTSDIRGYAIQRLIHLGTRLSSSQLGPIMQSGTYILNFGNLVSRQAMDSFFSEDPENEEFHYLNASAHHIRGTIIDTIKEREEDFDGQWISRLIMNENVMNLPGSYDYLELIEDRIQKAKARNQDWSEIFSLEVMLKIAGTRFETFENMGLKELVENFFEKNLIENPKVCADVIYGYFNLDINQDFNIKHQNDDLKTFVTALIENSSQILDPNWIVHLFEEVAHGKEMIRWTILIFNEPLLQVLLSNIESVDTELLIKLRKNPILVPKKDSELKELFKAIETLIEQRG